MMMMTVDGCCRRLDPTHLVLPIEVVGKYSRWLTETDAGISGQNLDKNFIYGNIVVPYSGKGVSIEGGHFFETCETTAIVFDDMET
jgi:hypothetical protein